MTIVSNSGPILSFARAHHLPLLRAVVDTLIIPAAVHDELLVQGAGRPGSQAILSAGWIQSRPVASRMLVEHLPQKLHIGEREAIALARELGATLLVDDNEARKQADRLGIEYFGSLRILKEAKARAIVPAIKPVLDELIAAGHYLSPALHQEFLHQVQEA